MPVALPMLSAIAMTVGTLRLIQLASGPAVVPSAHRFASFLFLLSSPQHLNQFRALS